MTHTTKSAAYRRGKEAAKEREKERKERARESARLAGPRPRKMRPPVPPPTAQDQDRLDRLAERRLRVREAQARIARRRKRAEARREARRPRAFKRGPAKGLQRVTEPSGLLERIPSPARRKGPKNTSREEARRRRQAERLNAKRRSA